MTGRFDWHDSQCGGMGTTGFDGAPLTLPCDCAMPEMFRSAYESGRTDIRARVETNLRVYDRRARNGSATDFDHGKAAAFRVVLAMLDPTPPTATFVCGRPEREDVR